MDILVKLASIFEKYAEIEELSVEDKYNLINNTLNEHIESGEYSEEESEKMKELLAAMELMWTESRKVHEVKDFELFTDILKSIMGLVKETRNAVIGIMRTALSPLPAEEAEEIKEDIKEFINELIGDLKELTSSRTKFEEAGQIEGFDISLGDIGPVNVGGTYRDITVPYDDIAAPGMSKGYKTKPVQKGEEELSSRDLRNQRRELIENAVRDLQKAEWERKNKRN